MVAVSELKAMCPRGLRRFILSSASGVCHNGHLVLVNALGCSLRRACAFPC
jgi:hypothetical protein